MYYSTCVHIYIKVILKNVPKSTGSSCQIAEITDMNKHASRIQYQDGGPSAFQYINKLPYFKEIYGK